MRIDLLVPDARRLFSTALTCLTPSDVLPLAFRPVVRCAASVAHAADCGPNTFELDPTMSDWFIRRPEDVTALRVRQTASASLLLLYRKQFGLVR